ncbi:MAG: 3-hydroxyacyl-[acyl-carrier-protein] dehydratase FabZ [Patescibacteria group bacterium]|nr:3-hydroxyacyl-[acyl-carrier-protein] dehydratase FabZ [Patescibacteria group bacterium]
MMLDKEQIKKIIPYDDPFLWVDEIESINEDTIIGHRQTSLEDSYFRGHFVDFPIMPGVLVIEGIAQTGTILLRKKIGEDHKNKHILAYQVEKANFYQPIFPGDKIEYRVKLLNFDNSKIASFEGEALVGENKKCQVKFLTAVVDKKQFKS